MKKVAHVMLCLVTLLLVPTVMYAKSSSATPKIPILQTKARAVARPVAKKALVEKKRVAIKDTVATAVGTSPTSSVVVATTSTPPKPLFSFDPIVIESLVVTTTSAATSSPARLRMPIQPLTVSCEMQLGPEGKYDLNLKKCVCDLNQVLYNGKCMRPNDACVMRFGSYVFGVRKSETAVECRCGVNFAFNQKRTACVYPNPANVTSE